ALFAFFPAFLVTLIWLVVQPMIVERTALSLIQPEDVAEGSSAALMMSDVRRIGAGLNDILAQNLASGAELKALVADPAALSEKLATAGVQMVGDINPHVAQAGLLWRNEIAEGQSLMAAVALIVAVALFVLAVLRIKPAFRARNEVERFTMVLLVGASSIAILTTVGIILSLVFETAHFFQLYPAQDFFLSLTWAPRFGGGSELGIWPLIWGTMYVSLIALMVAVPIGLMAAIYLSEYASKPLRAVAKPALEVLAGIPSIVYGLFALITVGPFLRDWLSQPMGWGDSSSSVMTAGLVMGIMLIPYVSSLSDDIINAVPQALRDGSYGLGATQSETIRQVVFPAALPGVVGAILMAASRAIGETMIVVLGAGAAAKLSANPFEAMTTVTVKIVSQLTGDTEFGSPETLVAFALGLTLFLFTLVLNILALHIVRDAADLDPVERVGRIPPDLL
ncbi:MAG: phosphate ABC transporter permease subunit PstC, partial [Rhodobacteraceae bacterium]|nr:phosphate ABC transporter permease subunit PstC [Paracoccaceae bacterium]